MLSIVIPVCDERESLESLHGELDEVARAHGYEMEIILIDDGSTDGSWSVIRRLAETDPRVRGIRFRRNFGKAAALSAGFRGARGEMVMTLDPGYVAGQWTGFPTNQFGEAGTSGPEARD